MFAGLSSKFTDEMLWYAAADAWVTMRLWEVNHGIELPQKGDTLHGAGPPLGAKPQISPATDENEYPATEAGGARGARELRA